MSFTRFHDDPARIKKENLETNAMNDYLFNVPGNTGGVQVPHFDDPHLRQQRGGGHIMTNMVGVESLLRNSVRPLNRDDVRLNNYKNQKIPGSGIFGSRIVRPEIIKKTIVSESRSTHPVFEYREKSTHRRDFLWHNPQNFVFMPFQNNMDTNILEKDYYNLKTYKKI